MKDKDTAINTISSCTESQHLPVQHQLVKLFWMLCPAYMRWAESHMDGEKLTPQRVQLLGQLKENGAMMMSNLRDALGVTATNITALVDALEKDGFVVRSAHPTDRRATMIDLTPEARQMVEENCAVFRERMSELFTVFSAQEQEQLLDYLQRMREALVERKILKL